MSTHNIGFYEDLTKLSLTYHQISSNTHLISSAVQSLFLRPSKHSFIEIGHEIFSTGSADSSRTVGSYW